MIYITGDTHGKFERIEEFCHKYQTTRQDIMIILGDAGINYFGGLQDTMKKEKLSKLPITLFCIHGNHEQRPTSFKSYHETLWHQGTVYLEEEYPNILFAKDGEIFDFDGVSTIVIGGAYSVDKAMRIAYGYGWWEEEQPSPQIKHYVEQQASQCDWKVDVVLSYTTPRKYEPVETFLMGIDQSTVDKSCEEWLDTIEDRLQYKKWYCGHYHTEKKIDKIEFMFENVALFYGQ